MNIETYLIIALLTLLILAVSKMLSTLENIGGLLHLIAFHQKEIEDGTFYCENIHDEDDDSPEYDSYMTDEELEDEEQPEPKQSDKLWEEWN
jgi:hypothetical protein